MTTSINKAVAVQVNAVHQLAAISLEIAAEHEKAQASATAAVAHAIRAGELLLRAKEQLPHGQWLPWLSANCSFSERTAQRYIRAAAPEPKSDNVSYLPGVTKPRPRPVKVKLSSKAANRLADLKGYQRTASVIAHVRHVATTLPDLAKLGEADIQALKNLRSRIDEALNRSA